VSVLEPQGARIIITDGAEAGIASKCINFGILQYANKEGGARLDMMAQQ
jgi:hypothetical protein